MMFTLVKLERLQELLLAADLSPFSLLPPLSVLTARTR